MNQKCKHKNIRFNLAFETTRMTRFGMIRKSSPLDREPYCMDCGERVTIPKANDNTN